MEGPARLSALKSGLSTLTPKMREKDPLAFVTMSRNIGELLSRVMDASAAGIAHFEQEESMFSDDGEPFLHPGIAALRRFDTELALIKDEYLAVTQEPVQLEHEPTENREWPIVASSGGGLAWDKSIVAFLHIPKAGGSSVKGACVFREGSGERARVLCNTELL